MFRLTGSLTRNCATPLLTIFDAQVSSSSRSTGRRIHSGRTVLLPVLHRAPGCYKRYLSTFTIDSSVRQVALGLGQTQPAFEVSASRIRVLKEPAEFYALLLNMIRRAEQRIFISSLYIGSAESELIEAIQKSLSEKPSLRLHLQLDLNRSTRPGASSTAKILLPLLQEFPDRVTVSMFRSPHLRGLLAKLVPPRFNEGWGTWHAKIYGVDDEVIISGANLNKSYFTNRQDRYIHFADQPQLADYCSDFLKAVSTFSYKLATRLGPAPHSYSHEGYFLDWSDPKTHPHEIHGKAEAALSSFQSAQRTIHGLNEKRLVSTKKSGGSDSVLLFPVIQAGQFNIREEESALALLFRSLAGGRSLVDLTSGYFGLSKPYQHLVLVNDVLTRIVAASPKANGFFGSKGISGRIPEGYTLLEQRFMSAVKRTGRLSGVELTEWEKDGWTYHAKENESESQRLKREKAAERQRRKRARDRNNGATGIPIMVFPDHHQHQMQHHSAPPQPTTPVPPPVIEYRDQNDYSAQPDLTPEEVARRDRVRAAARERQRKHRMLVRQRKQREMGNDLTMEEVHYRAGPDGNYQQVMPHEMPPLHSPNVHEPPFPQGQPLGGQTFASTLLLSFSCAPLLKQHLLRTLHMTNEELASLEPILAEAWEHWDHARRAHYAEQAAKAGLAPPNLGPTYPIELSPEQQAQVQQQAQQYAAAAAAALPPPDGNASEFRNRFHRSLAAPTPFRTYPAEPGGSGSTPSSSGGAPPPEGAAVTSAAAIDPHLNGQPNGRKSESPGSGDGDFGPDDPDFG
ncbi:hypothetical protein C0991_003185 [Blastosporella zonata]|nr:hypothetical protein C0991_003185 [Blastosporella zonata]